MALTARRNTKLHGDGISPMIISLAVLATKKIQAGSLVIGNSAGTCEPGKTATGYVALGRAEAEYDNTDSLTPAPVARIMTGVFSWENIGSIDNGDIGKTCYVYDDASVTLDGTGRSPAGTVVGLDDNGQVKVATSPIFPITGTGGAQVRSAVLTLAGPTDTAAGQGTGADTNGTARRYNLGAALPAGAIVTGHSIHLTTPFTGNTTLSLAIGTVTPVDDFDTMVTALDVMGSAGYYQGTLGDAPNSDFAAATYQGSQLTATLTPDGGSKVSAATVGSVTITVFYIDAT